LIDLSLHEKNLAFFFAACQFRTMKFFSFSILVGSFFLLLIACSSTKQMGKLATVPSVHAEVNTPESIQKKTDLRLKSEWQQAYAAGELRREVEVLIKVDAKLTHQKQKKLEKSGFHTRSIVSIIQTGSLELQNLEAICDLDFVLSLELANPMGLKSK